MEKHIEVKESGLKCDNLKCDWDDNSISVNEYEKWINAKCPKCNEIVLTLADFERSRMLNKIVELINDLSDEELHELTKNQLSGVETDEDYQKHLKNSEFFKDAKGIESVKIGNVDMVISSFGGLKCTEIKNVDENGSE